MVQEMDLTQPPPFMAQRIHQRLREKTGIADPYLAAKNRQNQLALELLPSLRAEVQIAASPILAAAPPGNRRQPDRYGRHR